MADPPKRLSLLWKAKDWQRLRRVRDGLGAESDTETLRRALQIAEAVLAGDATINGRRVVVPT